MDKTCTKCRLTKPETDFNLKPMSTVRRYAECKACASARMKRRHKERMSA